LDVVAVVALAAQEARVLLAQHPAVADRLQVVVLKVLGGTFPDGGHDGLPTPTESTVTPASVTLGSATAASAADAAAAWAAAHWIDRTIVAYPVHRQI